MRTPTLMDIAIVPVSTSAAAVEPRASHAVGAATVVIVNGGEEVAELVESVFGAGSFDVVMVASGARAYSQIRHVQPALVVLGVSFNDPAGFQVLSMLALDEATRHIPVLVHAAEGVPRSEAADEAAML